MPQVRWPRAQSPQPPAPASGWPRGRPLVVPARTVQDFPGRAGSSPDQGMGAPSREEQSPTTPALRDGIHDLCPRPLGQADSNQGEDFWEGNLRGAPPCA